MDWAIAGIERSTSGALSKKKCEIGSRLTDSFFVNFWVEFLDK
jgi:hypothetical protein